MAYPSTHFPVDPVPSAPREQDDNAVNQTLPHQGHCKNTIPYAIFSSEEPTSLTMTVRQQCPNDALASTAKAHQQQLIPTATSGSTFEQCWTWAVTLALPFIKTLPFASIIATSMAVKVFPHLWKLAVGKGGFAGPNPFRYFEKNTPTLEYGIARFAYLGGYWFALRYAKSIVRGSIKMLESTVSPENMVTPSNIANSTHQQHEGCGSLSNVQQQSIMQCLSAKASKYALEFCARTGILLAYSSEFDWDYMSMTHFSDLLIITEFVNIFE